MIWKILLEQLKLCYKLVLFPVEKRLLPMCTFFHTFKWGSVWTRKIQKVNGISFNRWKAESQLSLDISHVSLNRMNINHSIPVFTFIILNSFFQLWLNWNITGNSFKTKFYLYDESNFVVVPFTATTENVSIWIQRFLRFYDFLSNIKWIRQKDILNFFIYWLVKCKSVISVGIYLK